MADGAGAGRGAALRPLCLACCLCRLPVHCCPQHPASSAGVDHRRPLGMCHGSRCVAAPIRQAFPARDGELARCACDGSWALMQLVQVLSSSCLENPPSGSSQLSPGIWSCLVMGWLRCEPGVTLMWLHASAFNNSVGLLLQGMLSKHPVCSTQTLSDPAGPICLGRE